jgi:hypothetical protein
MDVVRVGDEDEGVPRPTPKEIAERGVPVAAPVLSHLRLGKPRAHVGKLEVSRVFRC